MFIRFHLFISVLFILILRGGSKKNLLYFMPVCSAFFLKSFIVSVHLFRPLICLQFIFVGIRSVLILSSFSSAQCPPQWLLPFSIPSISVGGLSFFNAFFNRHEAMIRSTDFWTLTPFAAFIVCRVSACGHSDRCEVTTRWSFDLRFSHI